MGSSRRRRKKNLLSIRTAEHLNIFMRKLLLQLIIFTLLFQWWRRQWVVLDIVETLDTPALIGRIYSSHLHEDRTLPSTTVTLTDVHALHRMQSRQVAFLATMVVLTKARRSSPWKNVSTDPSYGCVAQSVERPSKIPVWSNFTDADSNPG